MFTVTSAIGFIVGLALFGGDHVPAALPADRARRDSPTELRAPADADDGGRARHLDRQRAADQPARPLQAVPDRRHRADDGRARACSRGSASHADPGQAALYMLVLGLGLGMVMQVLVLAVQNAVDYAQLGVATSGVDSLPPDRRLDRRLALRRDLRQPARQPTSPSGCRPARTPGRRPTRRMIEQLPAGGARALRRRVRRGAPAGLPRRRRDRAVAFVLTWFLREVPLRKTAGAGEAAGEGLGLAAEKA